MGSGSGSGSGSGLGGYFESLLEQPSIRLGSGLAGEIIVFRYISFLPLSFQAPKRRDEYPTEYSLALLVERAPVLLAVFVLFFAFV